MVKEEGIKQEGESDICRDFLKNICDRGNRCKFYHPSDSTVSGKDKDIHFCIDYQNSGCRRGNCRFAHIDKDEAERYKITKEITLLIACAVAAVSPAGTNTIVGTPVCKEFQTGNCSRGIRCRFWHVNMDEERDRRRRGLPALASMGPPRHHRGPMEPPFRGLGHNDFGGPGYGGPMRRSFPHDDMGGYGNAKRARMGGEMERRKVEMEHHLGVLTKENEALKREIASAHSRYEDLYALFRAQAQGKLGTPALTTQELLQMHNMYHKMQPNGAPWGM